MLAPTRANYALSLRNLRCESTVIREFKPEDTRETAGVWHRSGLEEYTYLPEFQKLDETKAVEVFANVILKNCKVWVYQSGELILGFLAMKGSYIDRLYVVPEFQRRGVGAALIAHAKIVSPEHLELHTHQQNLRARAFYEKFGFVAVRFGLSPPPESLPDVEYHWRSPVHD